MSRWIHWWDTGCREVGGALGLQLLGTTVSSSSSLSERMWNGLLLQVGADGPMTFV